MEFRSNHKNGQQVTTFEKRVRYPAANDPQQKNYGKLDKNKKKLISGAIASYLKQLYIKSGIQGNPKKADVINQLNTILDHLPTAAKNYLSTFGNDLNLGPAKSQKQLADSFIHLLLEKAFKNSNPYSEQHKEILNEKVKSLIKKALERYEAIDDSSYQAKTVEVISESGAPAANSAADQHDQEVADAKLKAEEKAETIFDTGYHDFVKELNNIGSLLNLAKAYSALSKSSTENRFYSDSSLVMQNDDETQQQVIADLIYKLLNNQSSPEFGALRTFLNSQHVSSSIVDHIKSYFMGSGGVFPRDAKSLLTLILNPKEDSLYKGGRRASEVLQIRYLVFRGITQVLKQKTNRMYNPSDPQHQGTLLDSMEEVNHQRDEYNQFLKDHPKVKGTSFVNKFTFNEATGGFVMFSTFAEEYQIAEADRQAATLTSEGYNKTLNYLQEILAGVKKGIESYTDADTDSEEYLSSLTQDEVEYLGGLRLVKGGKTVADQYYSSHQKTSGDMSRANAKAILSKLNAIIKTYEDKNQKVGVILQDATEKRNIAATTLSKILDKLYDVYKLVAQF